MPKPLFTNDRRIFNGRVFTRAGFSSLKGDAQKQADRLRRYGGLVRITKVKGGYQLWGSSKLSSLIPGGKR